MKKSNNGAFLFHRWEFYAHVFKIMKITIFLFLIAIGSVIANSSYSQNTMSNLQPERRVITGKVTDSSGALIPGVTVLVKGTTIGTITDENGNYSISNITENASLKFSFVGMKTQEIAIGSRTTINVVLAEETVGIDEVVAVGYGVQKKVNLTGALSTVTSKELEGKSITNISSALQGTMVGVTAIVNNGQPGRDQATIRVRGIGTLGNSDAMIIVDGIVGFMNDINPADIESITVLKDAASAAIYGSRAANGVILITTKKGKKGEITAHYNLDFGQQKMTAVPDVLNSWESSTLYNEALVNEGKLPKYSAAEIQKFKDGSDPENYPNTDWYKLFWTGNGIQQNHSFDISGGNEKTQSYLSVGYLNQNGLVKQSSNDRYTTHFKIDTQLRPHIKLSSKIAYSQQLFHEPVSNIHSLDFGFLLLSLNQTARVVPNKINGYNGYSDEGNPVAVLNGGSNNFNKTNQLSAIFQADVEILKDLHFIPMLGYTSTILQSKTRINDLQYYDVYTGVPSIWQGPNKVASSSSFSNNLTLQALLQYNKTFGEHDLNFLGGYSQEHNKYDYLFGSRYGYLNNALSELDAGPVTGQQNSGNSSEYALQSIFGRINYSFRKKYLLEGNVRDDGSSRFAPSNRWAIFPSASVGWRISEEPFFEPVKKIVTDLKFRGSWGMLGNQNIGTYPYQATIASGQNYTFGGQTVDGISPINGVNANIKWESTETTDIGFDAVLLKGKASFTADYFIRNTSDILLPLPVMSAFGLNVPVINAGSVQNKGLELLAGYHLRKRDFTFDVNANVSIIKNEITSLAGTGPFPNGSTIQSVGLPINSLYGLVADGLFQNQAEIDSHADQSSMGGPVAPGDIKYKDLNNDKVIDSKDRQFLGSYFPKTTYGINISASYKGFDAVLFLQGVGGVKSFVSGRILGSLYDKNGAPTSIWWDRWTPTNPNASFPRVWNSYSQNDPSAVPSSFWVRDASYIRLKNVQIGYTLPVKLLARTGVKNARIFWTGKDILTITKFYKWVDPEAPIGGNSATYPMVMVNSLGINLTF
ncbi:TonB family protein [Aquipluma nitroreducens]|uniref:TonB family protein n=1 Tax=Aquipluma nitroreducens TaxID=2010828 RepID=A0A5K7SAL0_9BACT|nr:TonB-dependent receptor [Aquipluma nitroreducens]BBE18600.1 TonB family protein [Aquipluma nitroreducens]